MQWRYSDSHYGFRTGPVDICRNSAISNLYPHIHHQHVIPQMANTHHHLFPSLGITNNRTSYVHGQNDTFGVPCNGTRQTIVPTCSQDPSFHSAVLNTTLPRYMWGPPPPYSQPASLENVNSGENAPNEIPTISRSENNNSLDIPESTASGVSPSITTQRLVVNSDGSPNQNNLDPQPNLTRTTKSGILLSPSQSNECTPTKKSTYYDPASGALVDNTSHGSNRLSGSSSIKINDSFDDSVHSAMHIYEQAKTNENIKTSENKKSSNENTS